MRLEDASRARRADLVTGVWRDPFTFGAPVVEQWREGLTIAEIVQEMPGLPYDFADHGQVRVNDVIIPREMWWSVRPKGATATKPISVTFHVAMRGGRRGGSVGKQIFAIVAMLALTVATAGIAGGLLGPAGALSISSSMFAAGSVSASILAGAVGLAGSLAIAALTAPPQAKDKDEGSDTPSAASAEGNMVAPSGAISRVVGTRKVFPQLACEPVTDLVDDDEFVEAVYILAGPHKLDDLRVGDAALATAEDITYEVREGWDTDSPITLVTRQGRTLSPQIELSAAQVSKEDNSTLKPAADLTTRLPVWHAASTRNAPDEAWLHILLPEGLRTADDLTLQMAIPFRVRIRRRGDPHWINLPELHYSSNSAQQARLALVLKWSTGTPAPPAGTKNAWYAAYKVVPGQFTTPTTPGWNAHAYFSSGSGGDLLSVATAGSAKVANTELGTNTVTFWLDPAIFPKGVYDIEIKRGTAYRVAHFTPATYRYSSNWGGATSTSTFDFFHYSMFFGAAFIPYSRDKLAERAYFTRLVSIWNEHPLPMPGCAVVAVRARNRRVDRVSAVASGYVRDWNGSSWSNWTTTSNPAPHYRDVLSGALNLDPLPDALRNDEELLAWRQACIANDYTCDAIIEGRRIEEVLTLLGSCGYARPYQSETWSVVRDYDRSAEGPVQVFSARNMRGFKFRKAFARLPDGFRVTYRDDNADYDADQVIVMAAGKEGMANARLEQITIDGLVDPVKVEARARFDLGQGELRSTFYSFDAPLEAIVCRRGSLVAVQHDIISRRSGTARIKSLISGAPGKIAGVVLDSDVELVAGEATGIGIRLTDGAVRVVPLEDGDGSTNVLMFVTDMDDIEVPGSSYDAGSIHEVEPGCLCVIGELGSEFLRLIVSEVRPGKDLTASLTLVDEAPALFAA